MSIASYEARIAALPLSERRNLAAALGISMPRRLVAFVAVAEPGENLSELLKEQCRLKLPAYMVPQVVVLVDKLPRTPAGKVDRRVLDERPIAREATDATRREALSEAERVLMEIWSDVLGVEEISVDDDFFELGGDSLLSIRVLSRASRAGYDIDPELFLEQPTIAAQACAVAAAARESVLSPAPLGRLPLTPIQSWFFRHVRTDRQHWNQSLSLTVRQPLDEQAARALLDGLVARHDALRTCFIEDEGRWVQEVQPEASVTLRYLDLQSEGAAARVAVMEDVARSMHGELALETAPLLRAAYFRLAPGDDRLLLVFHHLVVDAFSLGLIAEELARGIPPGSAGQSMARFGELLAAPETLAGVIGDAGYWLDRTDDRPVSLPRKHPDPAVNVEGNRAVVRAELDPETTAALALSLRQLRQTQLVEGVLMGLVRTLCDWLGVDEVPVLVENHGRDLALQGDVTTTVGWLTRAYPVWLSAGTVSEPLDQQLARLRECYRAVPRSGIAYGLLMTHGSPALRTALNRAPYPEICFNFMSRQGTQNAGDGFEWLPPEYREHHRSQRCERAHLLDVNSEVTRAGTLAMEWIYCARYQDRTTIENLVTGCLDMLRQLANFDGSGRAAATPADFPLAAMDSAGLAGVSRLLKDADNRSSDR